MCRRAGVASHRGTGEDVAREVRAHAATPIMMLTAKAGTTNRIHGLELGADDYVTKPFSPVKSSCAHVPSCAAPPASPAPTRQPLTAAAACSSTKPATRSPPTASTAGLTATEWKLLITLASVPGRVFSRYELVNRVRGYEYQGYERTIDSHIRNLRHKIETDPHAPRLIDTVTALETRQPWRGWIEWRWANSSLRRARPHAPRGPRGRPGRGR